LGLTQKRCKKVVIVNSEGAKQSPNWEMGKEKGDADILTVMRSLLTNHISDAMTDILTSRGVFIGFPTLNNGMLPTVGGFLTYLGGLKPLNRIGFAFGSYGWGGQAVKEIQEFMTNLKWETPFKAFNVRYIPSNEKLMEIRKTGEKLGDIIKGKVPVKS